MKLGNVSIRNALKLYAALVAVVCIAMGALSIRKLQAFAAAAGDSSIDATLLVAALLVFNVALLMAGAVLLFRHIASRIDVIVAGTEDLRAGDCDLTRRLPPMTGNFGKACESLNGFVGQVHDVVASVAATADELATAAAQISAGNNELSERTERQASTLEETASSMEEFTASVKQNAENTRLARDLATGASVAAQRGGEVAAQAVAKIGAANASSRKIGAIVAAIDSIAFQTNILALNAAVEAARAGEQGRGFAVVASEVRALSQRSAAAAKEVKALVTDAIEQVDAGARLAAQAGGAMQEIVDATEKAATIISDIATLTGQQAAGIEQVNQAIVQLDGVTQQNATLVEHAAAAAASLRDQAEGLTVLISRFKVRREMPPEGADRRARSSLRPAARSAIYVPDASSGHAPRLSTAFAHSAMEMVSTQPGQPEADAARPIAVG